MSTNTNQPVQPYDTLGASLRAPAGGKGISPGKPEEYLAVSNHRAWIAGVLKLDAEAESALARNCLLYPLENDLFDIVRGAFTSGGVMVTTASSRFVLSVTVPVSGNNKQFTPVQLAEAAAKQLFDLPANALVFKELGSDGDNHYGIRDFNAGAKPMDPDWPFWGDVIAWWCDGLNAAFVTTKAPGGPTQETIMPTADQNRNWFTPPDNNNRNNMRTP